MKCDILFVGLYTELIFIEIKFRSCCCRDQSDKSCCFLNPHYSLIPLFFPERKLYHMYQLSQHFVESCLYDRNSHRFAFLSDSRLWEAMAKEAVPFPSNFDYFCFSLESFLCHPSLKLDLFNISLFVGC